MNITQEEYDYLRTHVLPLAVEETQRRRRKDPWGPNMLKLLGKLTDSEISRGLKISPMTLMHKRRSLNIDNAHRVKWSEQEIALLGTAPDTEIAARIGKTRVMVFNKRQKLGIPTFRKPGGKIGFEWTEESVAMLAGAPDREIAEILGISKNAVIAKRRKLGIPSHRDWPAIYKRDAGYLAVKYAASSLGVAIHPVKVGPDLSIITCLVYGGKIISVDIFTNGWVKVGSIKIRVKTSVSTATTAADGKAIADAVKSQVDSKRTETNA